MYPTVLNFMSCVLSITQEENQMREICGGKRSLESQTWLN